MAVCSVNGSVRFSSRAPSSFQLAIHPLRGWGGVAMLQKGRGTGTFPKKGLLFSLLGAAALVPLITAASPPTADDRRVEVALAQSAQKAAPAPEPTKRPRTAEQIVGGKCLQCHRAVVESFVKDR